MLTLRRAPSLVSTISQVGQVGQGLDLDEAQAAVVAHRGPVLRVLGAPGTGKTTTAVAVVVDRVNRDGVAPDQCLVLTASRAAAADLRDRITARIAGTTTEPLARTHQAFGFGILRQAAALRGDASPRLLSGPEQDVILRELLAGHACHEGKAPDWPDHMQAALGTRGFRTELRDLLMRAVERGLDPAGLAALGRASDRPEWVAAAQVLAEYDAVTAMSSPGSYDPASILGAAADLLESEPEVAERHSGRSGRAGHSGAGGGLRLIVVDDAQELTPAAARLLRVLRHPHIDLVLLGDPDVAVQTFRGADPAILGAGLAGLGSGQTIRLASSYRQPQSLREVSLRVSRRIGALAGATHRGLTNIPHGGRAEVRLLRGSSQEASLIAAELRSAHLLEGVPWSEMAVIVRGQGRTGTLRRILMAAGVPVTVPSTEVPVRDEMAVRPLLALLEVALTLAAGRPHPVDVQTAVDAVLSPIGGADAVGLRRLRRALRRNELDSGGARSSDELLVESLVAPEALALLGPEGAPARRVATAIAAGVEALRSAGSVTAESVLWALWQATGLAESWRRVALGGGPAAARADRDLDAVVALFDAAARYVDRLPQMGPRGFLEHIRGQDVAGDTLVARAPSHDTVCLLTPAGAAGRQWRFVVVAGVQEGVWPDLRLRGSLLGSERLVDVITGRGQSLRAAQAAVRNDETRLFLVAVSRASERLLVTAVRSEDEQPSVYLDIVDPPEERNDGDELRPFSEVPRPMTLTGLVAELRREVVLGAADGDRHTAAGQLARLAAARVPGADPSTWWALTPLSDMRPLRAPGSSVSVSPSRIESYASCSLRWLLSSCGGDGPSVGAASIGTLVHDIAADLGDADEATLISEVDRRWGRLGLPPGWLSGRQRLEAHAMVARLARYFDESALAGWKRVGVELDLRVELGLAVLSGRVDRLECHEGGGLRVVDLKTGSAKPTRADLLRHAQLGAYQVAVEHGAFAEHGTVSAGAALLQVGKAAGVKTTLQEQLPLSGDEDPGWAEALVTETAEGMAGSKFAATTGAMCTFCAVRSSCPAQPEGRVI